MIKILTIFATIFFLNTHMMSLVNAASTGETATTSSAIENDIVGTWNGTWKSGKYKGAATVIIDPIGKNKERVKFMLEGTGGGGSSQKTKRPRYRGYAPETPARGVG